MATGLPRRDGHLGQPRDVIPGGGGPRMQITSLSMVPHPFNH